jgi:hypothetical protein
LANLVELSKGNSSFVHNSHVRLVIRAFLLVLLAGLSLPAMAFNWQQPTDEELKMTAEPAAPGAAAIYLYREEVADDKLNFHQLYVRLKILTEEGKKYADVDMPVYEHSEFNIGDISGRTIHSDGTVIPFTGKAIEKLVVKSKDLQYRTRVFTLPDVQVGSILEYRYQLNYNDNLVYAPRWYIQQELYVRSVHFRFVPTTRGVVGDYGAQLTYTPLLPPGAKIDYSPTQRSYELTLKNIPALPTEDFMPPMHSLCYRVLFYYTAVSKSDEFWKTKGKEWSKEVDRFVAAGKLTDAVQKIVSPGDSDQQKLNKIYDAVMQLENTSFTREHSAAENKAEGLKVKTAADIWEQKRGNADEIALLFVGLARAAGLKAYAMVVTDRDREVFFKEFLTMSQLDDDIAIVELQGKENFFDPGERYCPFGQLYWTHAGVSGLRQTANGSELAATPTGDYKWAQTLRSASLKLDPDGTLHGQIRLVFQGVEATRWRLEALKKDEDAVKQEIENLLQQTLPPGVRAKANHIIGLKDWKTVLMVQLDVSGALGTATAKRVLFPAALFEAQGKALFVHEKREAPIDLHYSYAAQDTVTIELPKTLAVESVPKDAKLSLAQGAVYTVTYTVKDNVFSQKRLMVLANPLYMATEYGQLKDFYQKVNTQDQEQAILKLAAAGSGQ